MKKGKQMLSLVLVLLLLCGIPMSVSAVGTTTPTELKLIGAQPIVSGLVAPGSGIHNNTSWSDKGLTMYFNQTFNSHDNTHMYARVVVVDAADKIVSYNGKLLFWSTGNHSTNPWSIAGHSLAFTNANGITYNGAAVNTWATMIRLLAEDPALAGKGYRIQLRVYEYTGSTAENGYVDSLTATANGNQKLLATGTDATNIAGAKGDYAAVDIGTVAAGATTITQTGLITLDRVQMTDPVNMTLTFSEAATIDTARTNAVLEVVKANGTTVAASYAVTLTADTGKARLTSVTWETVKQALTANAGSYARLKLTEKNTVAARAEYAFNYAVDTVWGTNTDMPLHAYTQHNASTAADYVYCEVEAPSSTYVSPVKISVVGEYLASNGYKDYYVKMYFSDYVHINTPNQVFFTYHMTPNSNASYFWQESLVPSSIIYEDSKIGTDELTYGKVITGKFSVRPTYVARMDASLAASSANQFGVRFVEYNNYVVDGLVSPQVIQDMNGNGINAPNLTAGSDIAWCEVTAMPKVVSAVVQDANASTVDILVTFNKPVTMTSPVDYWSVIMRFNNATNGTSQKNLQKFSYVGGETINGKTYSNQIRFTVNANGQPLEANAGILFNEYNLHTNQHGSDHQVSPNVIADVDGIGLAPTHYASCTNATTGCSSARICLSYTPITLAQVAQKIVSVSRASENTVNVKFAMNVASIDTTKGITLGGRTVTAATGSAGAWTLTLDSALTGEDAVLKFPASSVTTGYNGQKVEKEMTVALSLSDRLAANGNTVTLTENITVDQLTVPTGKTLDLNGYTLTTDFVRATVGNIVDSTNGGGSIRIAKNDLNDNTHLLEVAADNPTLPLYDTEVGGYRFYTYSFTHQTKTVDNVAKFGMQLTFTNSEAYELIKNKDNADFDLSLTVSSEAMSEDVAYTFKSEILADYAAKKLSGDGANWTIVLNVRGIENLTEGQSFTVTPTAKSGTGVGSTATALTFTK